MKEKIERLEAELEEKIQLIYLKKEPEFSGSEVLSGVMSYPTFCIW